MKLQNLFNKIAGLFGSPGTLTPEEKAFIEEETRREILRQVARLKAETGLQKAIRWIRNIVLMAAALLLASVLFSSNIKWIWSYIILPEIGLWKAAFNGTLPSAETPTDKILNEAFDLDDSKLKQRKEAWTEVFNLWLHHYEIQNNRAMWDYDLANNMVTHELDSGHYLSIVRFFMESLESNLSKLTPTTKNYFENLLKKTKESSGKQNDPTEFLSNNLRIAHLDGFSLVKTYMTTHTPPAGAAPVGLEEQCYSGCRAKPNVYSSTDCRLRICRDPSSYWDCQDKKEGVFNCAAKKYEDRKRKWR